MLVSKGIWGGSLKITSENKNNLWFGVKFRGLFLAASLLHWRRFTAENRRSTPKKNVHWRLLTPYFLQFFLLFCGNPHCPPSNWHLKRSALRHNSRLKKGQGIEHLTLRQKLASNRRRANREVQTVNWEGGGEGAVERGVESSLKKAHKPWIRGTNRELGRGSTVKCKPWIRHFSPPKFQCFSSQFALHGLRALEPRKLLRVCNAQDLWVLLGIRRSRA